MPVIKSLRVPIGILDDVSYVSLEESCPSNAKSMWFKKGVLANRIYNYVSVFWRHLFSGLEWNKGSEKSVLVFWG